MFLSELKIWNFRKYGSGDDGAPGLHLSLTCRAMVRLAFQRSNLSIYYYVYLLLSSSFLALSAKCTIFVVVGRYSLI